MKKLITVILTLALAAGLYIAGCDIIDRATAIKPDWVGQLREQPQFINTIYP